MKTKVFQIIFVLSLFVSCGPKPSKSIANIIKDTDAYVSKVDADTNLKQEMIEGALTDAEGFKDIGKFEYTVYYENQTKALSKIKNLEVTDKTISESYYFKNGDLVLMNTNLGGASHKIYVQKNKIISETKTDATTQKLLLNKAKRFQKAFLKEH